MKALVKVGLLVISILIFAACHKSNPDQVSAGTIPNGDFEKWTMQRPLSWVTNGCPQCLPPYDTYVVKMDSPAYHGNYAAKLIYNGVYTATADCKFALATHPQSLTGYFKSNIYGADSVSVKITLYKNSLASDGGLWQGVSTISTYTKIVIPISQKSLAVDSALISIRGGHVGNISGNNTVLWIDDLTLQ